MYSGIFLLTSLRVTKRKSARCSDLRLPKNLSVGALSQQCYPYDSCSRSSHTASDTFYRHTPCLGHCDAEIPQPAGAPTVHRPADDLTRKKVHDHTTRSVSFLRSLENFLAPASRAAFLGLGLLVLPDKVERQIDSFAKKAAAFFKISRSNRSPWFYFFNRRFPSSSSRRSLPDPFGCCSSRC